MQKTFGSHYLIELVGCNAERLKSVQVVQEVLLKAAHEAQASVQDFRFKQFSPFGVSGVVLISESHITIHTWPEEAYAGADILTCGTQMDAARAVDVMKHGFEAKDAFVKVIPRGF